MPAIEALADFQAIVTSVRSMVDKGIRVQLDLPETETQTLATLHGLQRDDQVLRVVIYNDDEFQAELIANRKAK